MVFGWFKCQSSAADVPEVTGEITCEMHGRRRGPAL